MSPAWWMAAGFGISVLVGLIGMCSIERDLRQAVLEGLAAMVVGPFILVGYLFRSASWPRARKLSGRGLARWANMDADGHDSLWTLNYRGSGFIVIHRRKLRKRGIPTRGADAARYE